MLSGIGVLIFSGILVTQSCSKRDASGGANPNETMNLTDEELEGGVNGSINIASGVAFAQPLPPMLSAQVDTFKIGRSFFHTSWVVAPASTTAVDGLGPLFNQNSCNSCHIEDGRGRTPFSSSEQLSSVLIRLSIAGQDVH
ncbi:MAG TPA: di-heme oxidoredictase family protein, partial [Arachidicoccus sp.]